MKEAREAMAGRVEGKVAFITGAARGQGRSHAVRLAQEGADVIAIDACAPIETVTYKAATRADLDETVRLVEAEDRRCVAAVADVRDEAGLAAALAEGVEKLGRLDVVACNAGIATIVGPSIELSAQDWQVMMDVNLTGQWNTCKVAIPHLLESGGGGSVIITSSMAGFVGYANVAHYVVAKHGVVGLMRTLANEYGQHGIRFNTVHPTNVNSDMLMHEESYRLFRPDLEHPTEADFAEAAQTLQLMPIPWVEAIDVSNAVLWLASDEARYVTGITLPIDGGSLARAS
jgi:SDR family mycofactocin-dependent oxidoreductase